MPKIETTVSWAEQIAADNSHGYSQVNRNGPDYDCSSFIGTALSKTGFAVSKYSTTRNLESQLIKCGFKSAMLHGNVETFILPLVITLRCQLTLRILFTPASRRTVELMARQVIRPEEKYAFDLITVFRTVILFTIVTKEMMNLRILYHRQSNQNQHVVLTGRLPERITPMIVIICVLVLA